MPDTIATDKDSSWHRLVMAPVQRFRTVLDLWSGTEPGQIRIKPKSIRRFFALSGFAVWLVTIMEKDQPTTAIMAL